MKTKVDYEFHGANRRRMPPLREWIPHLERVSGPKVLGITDFEGDGRYHSLIDQKGGPERVKAKGYCHLPHQQTLLIHTEELNTKQGHVIIGGHPQNISFARKGGPMTIGELFDAIKVEGDYLKIMGDGNTETIRDYFINNPGDWKRCDGLKVRSSMIDPRDLWKDKKMQEMYRQLNEVLGNDGPGVVETSDGHRLKDMFRMYGIIDTVFSPEDLKNTQEVISRLRQEIKGIHITQGYGGKSVRGSLEHIGAVLWDQGVGPIPSIRGLLPGLTAGDPTHKQKK